MNCQLSQHQELLLMEGNAQQKGISPRQLARVGQGFPFSVAQRQGETMKVGGSGHDSSLAGLTPAAAESAPRG